MEEINYNQELADKITRREKDVINELITGGTSMEIAQRMGISINTIEAHRKNIYRKTGVNNPAQLIALLFRGGILI